MVLVLVVVHGTRSRFGKCLSLEENVTDHKRNYGNHIIGNGLWIIKAQNLRAFVSNLKKKNPPMVNKPVNQNYNQNYNQLSRTERIYIAGNYN